MKFIVIRKFKDQDGHVYAPGHTYPAKGKKLNKERAHELASGENKLGNVYIVPVVEYKPELLGIEPNAGQNDENADDNTENVNDAGNNADEYPKHTGGGYYELSNGEKVQGKDKAEEAEKALKG